MAGLVASSKLYCQTEHQETHTSFPKPKAASEANGHPPAESWLALAIALPGKRLLVSIEEMCFAWLQQEEVGIDETFSLPWRMPPYPEAWVPSHHTFASRAEISNTDYEDCWGGQR